ncbi:MAG TPA: aspartyl/asparaginyl beta-hydroxylase domain-containing protein [Planctomycetota bacterium]
MGAFPDPGRFPFVPALEREFTAILAELRALAPHEFLASPDSLTTVADGCDETGWLWYPLFGAPGEHAQNRARCPATARACEAVPGMRNASFSLFRPGTVLYPHHGELPSVLRCHLPLIVPEGDLALRAGGEIRRWQAGRCVIFDDTFEHDAWNRGASDRVVLIVTFAAAPSDARREGTL